MSYDIIICVRTERLRLYESKLKELREIIDRELREVLEYKKRSTPASRHSARYLYTRQGL